MLTHGDRINRWDVGSALLRIATQSRLMGWLITRSFGKRLVAWIKRHTGHDSHRKCSEARSDQRTMPVKQMERFAQRWFRKGARTILCGHFHERYVYEDGTGRSLCVLPSWRETREIARYELATGELTTGEWHRLLNVQAGTGQADETAERS